jgi:hypothetical protein
VDDLVNINIFTSGKKQGNWVQWMVEKTTCYLGWVRFAAGFNSRRTRKIR